MSFILLYPTGRAIFSVHSEWLFKLSCTHCAATFMRHFCVLSLGDFIVFVSIISVFPSKSYLNFFINFE